MQYQKGSRLTILVLAVLLSCIASLGRAQGQVVMTQPVLGNFGNPTYVQLLYLSLLNTYSTDLEVYLRVVLTEDAAILVDMNTAHFELEGGKLLRIDQHNAQDLLYPPVVNEIVVSMRDYEALTSELPPGSYRLCIDVILAADKTVLTQGCQDVGSQNFTSVNLLTPLNQGTTPNAYPIFTWSMLSGGAMAFDPNRYYAVKIVNLLEGQSPQIAMQANPAIFFEDGLSMNLLQYPITSQPLIACSTYAWQVEAYRQNGLVRRSLARSEVWSFKVACGSGIVVNHGGGNGLGSGGGVLSGGGGTLGGGNGTGGGATICADCDSVLCKNYGITLKRIRKDTTGYYQIWLDNKYTGSDRNFQPRSIKLVMRTDSVLAMPDSLNNRWRLETSPPVASKAQGWIVKSTRIPRGISTPGNLQLTGPSRDFVEVVVQWKNRKNRIVCRDTIRVFEATYYFDLNGPQADVVQETAEKKLRVQFHNPYAASEHLEVKIYDLATRQQLSPSSNQFSNQGTVQGLNRIAIDLKRYALTTGKTYLLEVGDLMGQYQMKFKPISQNPSSL